MKYVFFLSLLYKHFKKPCSFRIYLDDVMVDEVVLDKDINPIKDFKKKYVNESDGWEQEGQDPPFFQIYKNLDPQTMAEKIWIYHLDLKDSNKNIFLDFDVNDNNYTNGFMSRSALVKITRAGLIKESIFNRSRDFFMKRLEKQNRKFFRPGRPRFRISVPEDYQSHTSYLYRTAKKIPCDMFAYPSVDQFLVQIKNGGTMEEKEMWYQWCGGDFLVKLNLVKKHKNMILQKCSVPVKGVVEFDPYIIWLKQLPEVINMST
jgi:hypothetical protein